MKRKTNKPEIWNNGFLKDSQTLVHSISLLDTKKIIMTNQATKVIAKKIQTELKEPTTLILPFDVDDFMVKEEFFHGILEYEEAMDDEEYLFYDDDLDTLARRFYLQYGSGAKTFLLAGDVIVERLTLQLQAGARGVNKSVCRYDTTLLLPIGFKDEYDKTEFKEDLEEWEFEGNDPSELLNDWFKTMHTFLLNAKPDDLGFQQDLKRSLDQQKELTKNIKNTYVKFIKQREKEQQGKKG